MEERKGKDPGRRGSGEGRGVGGRGREQGSGKWELGRVWQRRLLGFWWVSRALDLGVSSFAG